MQVVCFFLDILPVPEGFYMSYYVRRILGYLFSVRESIEKVRRKTVEYEKRK